VQIAESVATTGLDCRRSKRADAERFADGRCEDCNAFSHGVEPSPADWWRSDQADNLPLTREALEVVVPSGFELRV